MTGSTIFGNGTGLLSTGGIIDDAGGNQLVGNGVNGTFSNAPQVPTPTPTPPPTPPATQTQGCTVPKLTGLKLRGARKRLANANCSLGKVARRTTKKRKRIGRVIAQRPAAGTERGAGAKVRVTLGRAAKKRR